GLKEVLACVRSASSSTGYDARCGSAGSGTGASSVTTGSGTGGTSTTGDPGRSIRAPQQRQLERIPQCLPAGLEDVLRAADRAPALVAARRLDQDAGLGRGAEVVVHDPHFVIHQAH